MKISTLVASKYLKKEDFPKPVLATISEVKKVDIAQPGEAAKERGCLFFREFDKPLVLNSTNLKRAAAVCNSDDTDDWPGKKIVIYHDPNVEFGGAVIGGLRLRAPQKPGPQGGAPRNPASPEVAEGKDHFADLVDDVPY